MTVSERAASIRCKKDGKPISIMFVDFPPQIQGKVRGLTVAKKDGYTIMIDSTRISLLQRRTLGHELAHIFLCHFDSSMKAPVGILEREANHYTWKYYHLFFDGDLPA